MLNRSKLLIVALILSSQLSAQTISQMQDEFSKIIPPSPCAAGLVGLTEESTNFSTGAVVVPISLYTVKLKDFEMPIKLVYKSSGIKVDQISSPVGLGWNLVSGGVITRSVRGIPDDRYERGFDDELHRGLFYSSSYTPYLDNSNRSTVLSWDKGFAGGYFDDEPDIFYFSFSGYSGQFFFDRSRQIHLSSKDNIKIDYFMDEYSPIISFRITAPDGNQYVMSTIEKTRTNLPNDFQYISSWYLTRVYTQYGVISFMYDDEDIEEEKVSGERKVYIDNAFQSWNKAKSVTKVRINGKRIKTINWDGGSIAFEAGLYVRQDLSINSNDTHPASAINAIVIRNNQNNIVKKFELEYEYFDNGASTPYDQKYLSRRLKLTKLSEIGGSDLGKITHTFFYNSYPLPNRNSTERDYWGYFNDNNSTTLIPDMWFYPDGGLNSVFPSQYSIFRRDYYAGEIYFKAGANRDVNDVAIKAGMLENIKYSTGGELKLIYEPNNFYFDGKTRTGGGIRVSEEQFDVNGIKKTKQYLYDSKTRIGESSGVIASLPCFAFQRTLHADSITSIEQLQKCSFFSVSNMYENGVFGGADVIYEDVTIKETNNGRKELKFEIPHITKNSFCLYSQDSSFVNIMPPTPTNAGAVFRESQGPTSAPPYFFHYCGVIPVKDYLSYYLPSDLSWAVGQLLEERVYSETSQNNPLKKVTYKYNLEQIEIFPAHSVELFDFSGTVLVSSFFNSGFVFGQFTYYAINKYNNISGIKKLTQKTEYIYDLVNGNSNVETKSFFFYNNSFNLLSSDSTILSNGYSLVNKYKYPSDFSSVGLPASCDVAKQTCIENALATYRQNLLICDQIPDANAKALCKQSYLSQYNNALAQCNSTYNSCIGSSLTDQQVITEMKNRNMIGIPLEEQQFVVRSGSSLLTGGKIRKYGKRNGLIVPIEEYHLETKSPTTNLTSLTFNSSQSMVFHPLYKQKLVFDSYSSDGDLQQYHLTDNNNVSFYWSYNSTLPVVKAENVSYTVLKSAVESAVKSATGTTDLESFWQNFNDISTNTSKQVLWQNFNTSLRSGLSNSLITTYTYLPLVGMTSQSDVNSITSYYDYDGLGRLKNVRDNNGNITGRNYYHYYNEVGSDLPSSSLTVSVSSVDFTSSASSTSVSITSGGSWSASSNSGWLTVSPSGGSSSGTLVINATANSGMARSGLITISNGSGLTKTVTVTQSASAVNTLAAGSTYVEIGQDGGLVDIPVYSNTAWSVVNFDDWISFQPGTGAGDGTLTVGASSWSDLRYGIITLQTDDGSITVDITIAQGPFMQE